MRHENENRKPHVFDFFTDPGHGWLFVPWTVVEVLGINTKEFSTYSYVDQNGVYLEEDCDLPKFEEIFLAKTDERIVFNEVIDWTGSVRAKRRLNSSRIAV